MIISYCTDMQVGSSRVCGVCRMDVLQLPLKTTPGVSGVMVTLIALITLNNFDNSNSPKTLPKDNPDGSGVIVSPNIPNYLSIL